MWRKRKREPESVSKVAAFDTGVGDECEAYLAGQLLAYLHETGIPALPVAWLNQIVHGTVDELALLAVGNPNGTPPTTWHRAQGYLARIVLERARETGRPIAQLQRELLLPLELELLDDSGAAQFDPPDVIRLAMARLYELPELPA